MVGYLTTAMAAFAIGVIAAVVGLVLHELAHIITARALGADVSVSEVSLTRFNVQFGWDTDVPPAYVAAVKLAPYPVALVGIAAVVAMMVVSWSVWQAFALVAFLSMVVHGIGGADFTDG